MSRRCPHQEGPGFTIMELMVVMAIFGLIMMAATVSIRNIGRADLRSAASRTAAAMRYTFDRATMTGSYMRLALDRENGKVWIERSDQMVTLRGGRQQNVLEKDDVDPGQEIRTRLQKHNESKGLSGGGASGSSSLLSTLFGSSSSDETDDSAGSGDAAEEETPVVPGLDGEKLQMEWELDMMPIRRQKVQFTPLQGMVARVIKLAKGIKIKSVVTPRMLEVPDDDDADDDEATTGAMEYIYFFPQGHSESAIVYFTDGNEKVYSVVLHPLTGRAQVFPCEFPISDDFGVSDDKRKASGDKECTDKGGL